MTYDRSNQWLASFEGVVSALVTPFDDRSQIDEVAIRGLVDLQLAAGVPAMMIGGTTGEFIAMDEGERRDTVTAFTEAVDGRARVIANVGHVDPGQCLRLAEHATSMGVDAVAAITPYFLPVTEHAVEAYLRDLARSVPETPVLAYHFPRNATNELPAAAFGRLLEEPNVVGAKCSVGTLEEVEAFLAYRDDATIMCGNDRLFGEFVAAGGRAVVSGNATTYPELIVEAFGRCLDGTWTDRDAELVGDIATAGRDGAPDRLKALLDRRGVTGGTARVQTYIEDEVIRDGNDEAAARVEQALQQRS